MAIPPETQTQQIGQQTLTEPVNVLQTESVISIWTSFAVEDA